MIVPWTVPCFSILYSTIGTVPLAATNPVSFGLFAALASYPLLFFTICHGETGTVASTSKGSDLLQRIAECTFEGTYEDPFHFWNC